MKLPVRQRPADPLPGVQGTARVGRRTSDVLSRVRPGDIVVADRDGVVAIPLAQAQAVADQLKLVKQKEADAERKVLRGEKLQFWNEAALQGRVRYLD